MWLTCSSVGRKLVMAITGACLVLFVTFHCLMNGVALFWPSGYNAVCEFLGANWYALVATIGLAALFIIHIIYALWLTIQNRKARGNDRYKVVTKPVGVEWSSQNMLVLGIVVLAFLVVHLIQFWAKMQLAEILHCDYVHDGVEVAPAAGTIFIQIAFSQIWTPIVYIIGFIALWFHMNHGFWSMFQTAGWDNDTWLPRLKTISCWWTTIVVALFIAQAVVFTVRANSSDFQKELTEYNLSRGSAFALDTDAVECGSKVCSETACPQAACPNAVDCPNAAACTEAPCAAQQCAEGCCVEGVCQNPDCQNPACGGK